MSSVAIETPDTPQGLGSGLRVGLFGRLGSGNIGNDASMEAILNFLRSSHPDAEVDVLCYGQPEQITETYGIDAQALSWYYEHWRGTKGARAVVLKLLGKCLDLLHTAEWVRRHDAVIIPGMGVLETSLPVRASEFPFALFLVCALGKVFRTQIALVCVGAGPVKKRITRSLYDSAVRLASYRSYRDAASRRFLGLRGTDTSGDSVFPDLAFSLPSPVCAGGDAELVGVGVMAYRGGNDDRERAESIYASYLEQMQQFVIWLVDSGRRVTMLVGDTNGSDHEVVEAILDHLHRERPDLDPSLVHAAEVSSLADVMDVLRPVGAVVAMRYHNVVGALKLCKPTIAIGYAAKHDALMADVGAPEFCLPVSTLSTDQLVARFTDLVRRSDEVSGRLVEHLSDYSSRLDAAVRRAVRCAGICSSPQDDCSHPARWWSAWPRIGRRGFRRRTGRRPRIATTALPAEVELEVPVRHIECRACHGPHGDLVVDLGEQPASDYFPPCEQPGPDPVYPLRMWLCGSCGLAQLVGEDTTPEEPSGSEPAALVAQATDAVERIAASGWLPSGVRVGEFRSPHGGSWLGLLEARGSRSRPGRGTGRRRNRLLRPDARVRPSCRFGRAARPARYRGSVPRSVPLAGCDPPPWTVERAASRPLRLLLHDGLGSHAENRGLQPTRPRGSSTSTEGRSSLRPAATPTTGAVQTSRCSHCSPEMREPGCRIRRCSAVSSTRQRRAQRAWRSGWSLSARPGAGWSATGPPREQSPCWSRPAWTGPSCPLSWTPPRRSSGFGCRGPTSPWSAPPSSGRTRREKSWSSFRSSLRRFASPSPRSRLVAAVGWTPRHSAPEPGSPSAGAYQGSSPGLLKE